MQPSEPISANMAALIERTKEDSLSNGYKRVLSKLIALQETSRNCDMRAYEILLDNDEATGKKSHDVTSRKAAPRRVDKLIHHYSWEHALTCLKRAEESFEAKRKQLDETALHRLSTWLDPIIERIVAKYETETKKATDGGDELSKLINAVIIKEGQHPAASNLKIAYEAIKTLVKDDPDDEQYLHFYSDELAGARKFSKEKYAQLFNKYLKGSCLLFVEQFGDLFEVASYDVIFYREFKSESPEFYRVWAYSRICTDAFVKPGKLMHDRWDYWPIHYLENYAKDVADDKEDKEDEDD